MCAGASGRRRFPEGSIAGPGAGCRRVPEEVPVQCAGPGARRFGKARKGSRRFRCRARRRLQAQVLESSVKSSEQGSGQGSGRFLSCWVVAGQVPGKVQSSVLVLLCGSGGFWARFRKVLILVGKVLSGQGSKRFRSSWVVGTKFRARFRKVPVLVGGSGASSVQGSGRFRSWWVGQAAGKVAEDWGLGMHVWGQVPGKVD